MARLADDLISIDADDLLRPVRNPFQVTLHWTDGTQATRQIPLTFTDTGFKGSRAWFVCPHCKQRRRKLYMDSLKRVLWCRHCLGLRYRSQEQVFKGMRLLKALRERREKHY
jgi:hypothetical protein